MLAGGERTMTFAAYVESIKAKTGLGPTDFVERAAAKGFTTATKAAEIVSWLKADYGLGQGHAMAVVNVLKTSWQGGKTPNAERIDKLFSGTRAEWRLPAEGLITKCQEWGEVGLAPTDTYLSLLRGRGKFAILVPAASHMDIGIKLKAAESTIRFAAAGSWNMMVTHRVRIASAKEIDSEVLRWLKAAYQAA